MTHKEPDHYFTIIILPYIISLYIISPYVISPNIGVMSGKQKSRMKEVSVEYQ